MMHIASLIVLDPSRINVKSHDKYTRLMRLILFSYFNYRNSDRSVPETENAHSCSSSVFVPIGFVPLSP